MKSLVIKALALYQRAVSPLLPPACRFEPTCSEYAKQAVEIHGVVRGGALAFWRILRCNPFVRGGYDPVPPQRCGCELPALPHNAASSETRDS